MTNKEIKDWINNASYKELLRRWRFAPSGDPFFQGKVGDYYAKVMQERRKEIKEAVHVAASKNIGWGVQKRWI